MTTTHRITIAPMTYGDAQEFLALVDAVEAAHPSSWAHTCAARELDVYMTENQFKIADMLARFLRQPHD